MPELVGQGKVCREDDVRALPYPIAIGLSNEGGAALSRMTILVPYHMVQVQIIQFSGKTWVNMEVGDTRFFFFFSGTLRFLFSLTIR